MESETSYPQGKSVSRLSIIIGFLGRTTGYNLPMLRLAPFIIHHGCT